MLRCVFYLTVICKDAEAVFVRMDTNLPFLPHEGMRIDFKDDDSENAGYCWADCDRVSYSVERDVVDIQFTLEHGSDCSCKPENECCIFDPNEYIKGGRQLEEVRRGYKRQHRRSWMFEPDKHWLNDPEDEPTRPDTPTADDRQE